MTLRLNDGFRHSKLDALDDIVALDVYTGAQPAAGAAASGTLLGTITGITWGAAAAGARSVNASTDDEDADASGTAGWGRFRNAGGTVFFDGAVGSEFTLDDPDIVAGGVISLTSATYTQPAE